MNTKLVMCIGFTMLACLNTFCAEIACAVFIG